MAGKIGGRGADRIGAEAREPLANVGQFENALHFEGDLVDQARSDVGRAGRERNNDANRLVGIGIGLGVGRQRQAAEQQAEQQSLGFMRVSGRMGWGGRTTAS